MTDVVRLERVMPASAIRLFEMVSQPQNMIRWWGHDDMIVPEHNLDFSAPGPWFSIMESSDGTRRMVSGEVTQVDRFSDQTAGRRARTWVRWIHTGEAGGWIGQVRGEGFDHHVQP